jgi:hypothetical protein
VMGERAAMVVVGRSSRGVAMAGLLACWLAGLLACWLAGWLVGGGKMYDDACGVCVWERTRSIGSCCVKGS